jgi:hypothetical protein
MPTIHTKPDFYDTPVAIELRSQLVDMEANETYTTVSSYSPKTDLYSDNMIPFVDKHMHYFRTHPNLNMNQYMANLKILCRVR